MVEFPPALDTKCFIYGARDNDSLEYRYIGLSSTGLTRLKRHVHILSKPTHPEYASYKYNWMRSCGNLTFDIIEYAEDRTLLNSMERQWIKAYKDAGHHLTNLTDGGEGMFGHKFSDETKKKMSESAKGRIVSEETRARLSAAHKGKTFSDETKRKLSEANKGERSVWLGITGKDHPRYGKITSEETKRKFSEAHSGENHWAFGLKGPDHPNFGKRHSEESKRKIGLSSKGRVTSAETRVKLSKAKKGKKTGRPSWNKGIPSSAETRAKLSAARVGLPPTGQHTRWHTNRGIVNPDCELCTS